MITSCTRYASSTSASSSIRPSERRPLSGRGVSEMKPTISTGACTSLVSAWATSSMWRPQPTSTARRRAPGAAEHGAAAVAGGAEQHAGEPLVHPARGADEDDREDEGAVEDVVAGVV